MSFSLCMDDRFPDKAYKNIIKLVNELMSKDEKFTVDILDGEEVNIYGVMVYLVSKYSSTNLKGLAGINSLDSAIDMHRRMSNTKNLNTKETESVEVEVIQSSFGTNNRHRVIGSMIDSLSNSNNDVKAIVIADAAILTTTTMTYNNSFFESPYTSCILTIWHWVIRKFRKILSTIPNWKRSSISLSGCEIEDIADFIKSKITEKHAYTVCIEYLKMSLGGESEPEWVVYYRLMDKFADSIVKTSKKNDNAAKILRDAEKFIKEGNHSTESFVELLDKRLMRRYAAIMASSYNCSTFGDTRFNFDVLYLFVYRLLIEEKRNVTCLSDKALKSFITNLSSFISIWNSISIYKYLACHLSNAGNTLESNERCIDTQKERILKLENTSNTLKQELKALKKELSNSRDEAKRMTNLCKKLEGRVNCTVDIEQMHKEIEWLTERLNNSSKREEEANRKLVKREKDIDMLTKRIESLESENNSLKAKYERQREISSEMSTHRAFNSIDINRFVNAIKKFKIALVGGDMMFTRLAEYGLDNLRTYKAGCRYISYEDISDMDLVVAATAFVDHSTLESVLNAKKSHGINVMMYNNKNADMLILEMFNELYK